MAKRGFCGIAFYEPKDSKNVGMVFRNAHCFDVDFICTIGERVCYSEASNTTKAQRHIPVFKFKTLDDFYEHIPKNADVVSVEVDGDEMSSFKHPETAIYLFGGEDRTLPHVQPIPAHRVSIDTKFCLNMAVTSGIVLYDRQVKLLSGK